MNATAVTARPLNMTSGVGHNSSAMAEAELSELMGELAALGETSGAAKDALPNMALRIVDAVRQGKGGISSSGKFTNARGEEVSCAEYLYDAYFEAQNGAAKLNKSEDGKTANVSKVQTFIKFAELKRTNSVLAAEDAFQPDDILVFVQKEWAKANATPKADRPEGVSLRPLYESMLSAARFQINKCGVDDKKTDPVRAMTYEDAEAALWKPKSKNDFASWLKALHANVEQTREERRGKKDDPDSVLSRLPDGVVKADVQDKMHDLLDVIEELAKEAGVSLVEDAVTEAEEEVAEPEPEAPAPKAKKGGKKKAAAGLPAELDI